MKITLDMARHIADSADRMYDRLRARLDELKDLPAVGIAGSRGFSNVADVAKHLEMREQQIGEMRAEITELESTDADSETVLRIAKRLGLKP